MDIKKKMQVWICIAAVIMLVSMIGASLVQSSGGKIKVKDLRWETSIGYEMSGLLFVPEGVTEANKAPAIVTCHGMYNNRETQDANFVELSRRGYVVLSMDMLSHGNSEYVPNIEVLQTGLYEAVKMVASLNYVDTARIGITGHSLGSMSAVTAVSQDNAAPNRLIGAVLLNCADATYKDPATQEYINLYGNRDTGIIAAKYDEFFMRDVDGEGNITPPRDFVKYSNAQSFLHFGTDPAGSDQRVAETMYHEAIDGKDTIRVIYNPNIIHPWSHFSKRSTTATIGFFDTVFGAPNPIPADNQIWQVKETFNLLGLIGFAMFVVCFATRMVYTGFFASLRADKAAVVNGEADAVNRETDAVNREVAAAADSGKGKAWFWGMIIVSMAFGTLSYIPILTGTNSFTFAKDTWPQSHNWGIGVWAAVCGLFSILLMVSFYYLRGKKAGLDLRERGIRIPLHKLGKTILLAVIVVGASFAWVFFADYFFKTDFRIWLVAVKAFGADKIFVALFPYSILFLVFFVANSVAINSFNKIGSEDGKGEGVTTAILAVVNTLPLAILVLLQYGNFFITGHLLFPKANIRIIWTFSLLVIVPVTVVISRKLYRVTRNPYLPGIINGLMVTLISCSNSLTWS